jgi:isopenicillin-N N-acyltransferase-like protein
MIVMEPELGTMDVAMLPALNREFTRYQLAMTVTKPTATSSYGQAAE